MNIDLSEGKSIEVFGCMNFQKIFLGVAVYFFLIPQILGQTKEIIETDTSQIIASQDYKILLTRVLSSLHHPWSLAILPDESLLITERRGRLLYLEPRKKSPHTIQGLPKIRSKGQGGLLDIIISPEYLKDYLIFFSFVERRKDLSRIVLARARFNKKKKRLEDLRIIFRANRFHPSNIHYGGRLLFLKDQTLIMSIGDRGKRALAQDLRDHSGSIIRIDPHGRSPQDNPFAKRKGSRAFIYSYGHRNPQGLATGLLDEIWESEHGPRGGDELNLIQRGKNYGWPLITYGREYRNNAPIGIGVSAPGYISPIRYWTPSPAPSGLMIYSGRHFKKWEGNIFMGTLVQKSLFRLEVYNKKVKKQEILFRRIIGRIRDVREDAAGKIWILSDSSNAGLYRLQRYRRKAGSID